MKIARSIFEYDDFRSFLADFYQSAKAANSHFSFRYFARIAGFKSSNFLYLVMKGRSNVSEESADKIAKALKLNKEETSFFKSLVRFNQAPTFAEKQKHTEELLRSRTFKKLYPLSQYQYRYFSQWYFTIVRGLVGLPGFREDPQWIASRINPQITPVEAEQALEELKKLGMIARDPDGKLVQAQANVTSSSALTTSSLAQFHREMMVKAAESIDRVPREKRDLSAMTVGVSTETAAKIKEMAAKFRADIIDVVSRDSSPHILYQLNFYLFPMAEIEEQGAKS